MLEPKEENKTDDVREIHGLIIKELFLKVRE